jgi:hypothetical protein
MNLFTMMGTGRCVAKFIINAGIILRKKSTKNWVPVAPQRKWKHNYDVIFGKVAVYGLVMRIETREVGRVIDVQQNQLK